jgi:hypothetical protein
METVENKIKFNTRQAMYSNLTLKRFHVTIMARQIINTPSLCL